MFNMSINNSAGTKNIFSIKKLKVRISDPAYSVELKKSWSMLRGLTMVQ